MDTYKEYLAENVLTEDKIVTYRHLSRALNVHSNTAKQMLYDFHKTQNAKRPGAVHATYLVYGARKHVKSTPQNGADEDVEMTGSEEETVRTSGVPTLTLAVIAEEQLKDTLAEYYEVSSIHVYSVGPSPVKDFTLLAHAAREALNLDKPEQKYSAISNPYVRRRERKGPGARAAAVPVQVKSETKPASSKSTPVPAKVKEETKKSDTRKSFFGASSAPNKPKDETKAAPTPTDAEKPSSTAPVKKPAPALKRGGSGIMQAFSKAATKVKKTDASQPATPSGDDSTAQPLSDDGEDDEVEMPKARVSATSGRKSKKEREEELRRMMEEDDEEEEEEEREEREESPPEEPVEEPVVEEPVKEEKTEVVSASSDGRRRGKRRVMRKKQIMDDQGYLVTIQEPGWESFSEDETPPASKQKTSSSAPPAPAAKSKKAGAKMGQGSIMSFFSKK